MRAGGRRGGRCVDSIAVARNRFSTTAGPPQKSSCQNRLRTRIFTRRCTERRPTANNTPI